MPKRIPLTDDIKAMITASVGSEINFDQVAVFEAAAVTGRPINQRYSMYDGAVVQPDAMQAMADHLNSGKFVPLHLLHEQRWTLPSGRLFQGKLGMDNENIPQLHTLFYIDTSDTEGQSLAGKVDNGTIEEVSIGFMAEKLLCSACNFDFMQDEDALWDRTCANGHVLGMGGHHLKLSGLKSFLEMSLVSKGASTGAKILADKKRLLASQFEPLAASCHNPERIALFASPTLAEEVDMKELEELKASFETLKQTVDNQATALTAAQAKIDEQATALTAAQTKIEEQTEALAKFSGLGEKVTALTELADSAEDLKNTAGKVTELEAKLAEAQAAAPMKPAQPFKIPLDGVQNLRAAAAPVQTTTSSGRTQSFKTNRK